MEDQKKVEATLVQQLPHHPHRSRRDTKAGAGVPLMNSPTPRKSVSFSFSSSSFSSSSSSSSSLVTEVPTEKEKESAPKPVSKKKVKKEEEEKKKKKKKDAAIAEAAAETPSSKKKKPTRSGESKTKKVTKKKKGGQSGVEQEPTAAIPIPLLAEASTRKAEEGEREEKAKRAKIVHSASASASEKVVERLPLPPAPSQPRLFAPSSTSSSRSSSDSTPTPRPPSPSSVAAAAPPSSSLVAAEVVPQSSASSSSSPPLSIPRPRVFSSSDFEGWQPQHLLGRGSYGAVYKGLLRDGHTIACCKVIELTPEGNEAELHRLHMEVALMKQLYHPNVVQYFGSLEEHQSTPVFMTSSSSLCSAPSKHSPMGGMSTAGTWSSSGASMTIESNGNPAHGAAPILAPSSSSSSSSPLSQAVASSDGSARETSRTTQGGTSGGGGGLTGFPPSSSFSSSKTSGLTFSRLTIFMEFVSGCSLNQVLKKFGPIPFATLRQWVWQMVLGVQYLHSRGIVHRDIKGANVLLSMDGVIKLVDFGCSKWLQDPSSLPRSSISSTTTTPASRRSLSTASLPAFATAKRLSDAWKLGGPLEHGSGGGGPGLTSGSSNSSSSGNRPLSHSSADMYDAQGCHTLIGTPYWMAPEVICGDSGGYGLKSDIWSVGCTIVELLTGKPPWPESTSMWAAVWKIANSTGLPTEIPKNLDPELMNFLEACFERDPVKRPSAEELLQHPFLAHVTEGPAKPPEAKPTGENVL